MTESCSICNSTDISDNCFCNQCGNRVCPICGGEEFDDFTQSDSETYCQGCGNESPVL